MKIVDLLEQLNIDYRLDGHEHCRAGWVQIDCPWCTPGSGYFRLGINLAYHTSNCWACGPRRTPDILGKCARLPFTTVYEMLKSLEREYSSPGAPILSRQ